ncbi:GAL4-like Zn(II)2Cys6 (or C6 zinc) binuclear cluster DNA-binding domain [Rhizoctonia solani]|uniref:GAL4-like Zn(II)2Cys6 (Or C6 zinc) binuclear cluster DNA-binding domain n=1 Tax=Rhizoctonia solani TaxID=456999 RepID=A0A8H7M5N2_9AGAM|nr:GAL4-like Zn(II)2Cys6 (or C6 zinc) binuclear cluster DNA-binding domain [Rhizoctonia solani]
MMCGEDEPVGAVRLDRSHPPKFDIATHTGFTGHTYSLWPPSAHSAPRPDQQAVLRPPILMPKPAASSGPALRRNQACQQCRRRKLKCDAGRPHCGTCVRQWNALIAVPPPVGFSHPPAPTCSYDPVEGVPVVPDSIEDPVERIKIIEAQIEDLQNKLQSARREAKQKGHDIGKSPSPRCNYPRRWQGPHVEQQRKHATPYARPRAATRANTATDSSSHTPVRRPPTSSRSLPADYSPQAQPDKDWDPNLPAPNIVAHLVELFFQNDPCASRILHRSSRWASHDAPSRQEKFAEFHAAKTRTILETALRANSTDLAIFQASIILQYWAYAEGRNLDIKFNARPFLEPTPSNTQMEEKRRAWWSLVMFDRYVSLGAWKPSVAEADLMAIELPICTVDFECEFGFPNPQKVHDPSFFLSHPIGYTDSYIILIKATLLFGKVTDYNLTVDSRSSRRSGDPRDSAVFRALDRLVAVDFLQSLPDDYKSCLGAGSTGSMVDADLYLAHVLPYAATISLHNAHIDYSNPGCPSAVRCIQAARSIIRNYFLLNGTLFDTKRLHPFVTTYNYGDRGGEATVWGEIETLKLAMLEFEISLRLDYDKKSSFKKQLVNDVIQKPVLPANFGLDIPMYTYPLQDLAVSLSEHGSPEGSNSIIMIILIRLKFTEWPGPRKARVHVPKRGISTSAHCSGIPPYGKIEVEPESDHDDYTVEDKFGIPLSRPSELGEIPHDEQMRLINETGILGRLPAKDEEKLSPLVDSILDTTIMAIPLGTLYIVLDLLVQQQYAQQPTIKEEVGRVVTNVPTNKYKATPLAQLMLFLTAILAGPRMIWLVNKGSWLHVTRQAPPLGTIWIYTIIQLNLMPAVATDASGYIRVILLSSSSTPQASFLIPQSNNMAVTSNEYSRAIFVKRKRVDEPMDALMIDLPSQTKRYRGAGEGQGVFALAETMTEDPSLLDDQKAKDLHKRLAMINQEPRASPKVSSPVAMVMSPPGAPRSAPPPTREYKVLRTTRAPSSAVTSNVAQSSSLPTGAATARAPVPIPIPGQPLPSTSTSTVTDQTEPPEPKFVLYEAVLAGPSIVEQPEEPAPEMQEFQDLLQEYLRVNEISLDAPPPRKPVTSNSATASKKPVDEDEDEVYVWDVFYQRQNLSGDLSIWDGLANVGTLSGLPPTEGDILADEEESDSVKDEADEDSNEEDFYRNDYPDTESESDVTATTSGDDITINFVPFLSASRSTTVKY